MAGQMLRNKTFGVALTLFVAFAQSGVATPRTVVQLQPGQKQLFLDNKAIEMLDGVDRIMHQVRKWPDNPILKPEHPWERNRKRESCHSREVERGVMYAKRIAFRLKGVT